MSEGNDKPTVIRDAPQRTVISDRGVDLTLIRRLVKLTPAERLRIGVANSNAMFEFAAKARQK